MTSTVKYARLSHNLISYYAASGINALMSFLFVPLYIKYLGVESYGVIGFFGSIQSVLYLLDMGLSLTFSREIAALSGKPDSAQTMRNLTRTFAMVYWGIAIFAGIVFASLAPFFANHWLRVETLDKSTITWATITMGILIVVRWPGNIYSGGLAGLQRFVDANIISIIVAILRGLGVVAILKWVSPTLMGFFGWQAIITLLGTVAYQIVLSIRLPSSGSAPTFSLALVLEKWKFAAGMTGISVVSLILSQLDKLILSKLVSLKDLGYYTLGSTLAGVITMVVVPITGTFFPKFTALAAVDDRSTLKTSFHTACQLVALGVTPCAITVAFYSREILLIWTRNQDIADKAHVVLSIVIIGSMFSAFVHVPLHMLLAHSITKVAFWYNVFAVAFLAPAIFYLAGRYGILGGASAWLILNVSYVTVESWFIFKFVISDQIWKWYLQDIALPLGISLIVVLLSGFFKYSGNALPIMAFHIGIPALVAYFLTALATPGTRKFMLFWAMSALARTA